MADGYIFVYGTLMSGFGNHQHYLAGRVLSIERVTVEGELYHLRYGYPALTPGAGKAAGELILLWCACPLFCTSGLRAPGLKNLVGQFQ